MNMEVPMESVEMFSAVVMGLALAATCGLRAFLPLFAVGCLGALGQIELAASFQWLSRPVALMGLGLALLLEVSGDKFPIVDHFLDSAAVVIKPIAAMIVAASVMTDADPMVTTILGLVVGGSMAEGVHLVKAKVRLMSSAFTATLANPIISFIEDVVAIISTVLAVLMPLLVFVLALVGCGLGFRWWMQRRSLEPEEQ
jgi:hypothetical protein